MRIVRVQYRDEVFYAKQEGESLRPLVGLPYDAIREDGRVLPLSDCRLLAPCEPGKIVAVGDNYLDHIKEMNDAVPEEPVIFLKPSTSVIAAGESIVRPKRSSRVDYEAELALVIGKRCRNVSRDEAKDYIFGYTCLNDVTARDLQPLDGQWTRAKGFDTFAPIGPAIETDLDPFHLAVRSYVNGKVCQDGNSGQMMRDTYTLLAFASSVMTLLPGDVISLGTPKGVGPVVAGDEVTVEVEGIGRLTNPVCDEA